MVEDLLHVALLDHVAAVHDDHLVGDVRDHAHVVGDDEHGGVELVTGEAQQVENFGLHGHVEGSGGLVGQNQAGVQHQRMAMTMRCFWPPENWCG